MDPERGGQGPREGGTETQREGIGTQRKGDRETWGGGQNQRKVDSMGEQRPKVGGFVAQQGDG